MLIAVLGGGGSDWIDEGSDGVDEGGLGGVSGAGVQLLAADQMVRRVKQVTLPAKRLRVVQE